MAPPWDGPTWMSVLGLPTMPDFLTFLGSKRAARLARIRPFRSSPASCWLVWQYLEQIKHNYIHEI